MGALGLKEPLLSRKGGKSGAEGKSGLRLGLTGRRRKVARRNLLGRAMSRLYLRERKLSGGGAGLAEEVAQRVEEVQA